VCVCVCVCVCSCAQMCLLVRMRSLQRSALPASMHARVQEQGRMGTTCRPAMVGTEPNDRWPPPTSSHAAHRGCCCCCCSSPLPLQLLLLLLLMARAWPWMRAGPWSGACRSCRVHPPRRAQHADFPWCRSTPRCGGLRAKGRAAKARGSACATAWTARTHALRLPASSGCPSPSASQLVGGLPRSSGCPLLCCGELLW